MSRPIIHPLSDNFRTYGRLDGVSRFYSRVPSFTPAISRFLTTNPTTFVPAADHWTVIERIHIDGFTPNPDVQFNRLTVTIQVLDEDDAPLAIFYWRFGNFFIDVSGNTTAQANQVRKVWDTKGALTIPPGHRVTMQVSNATLCKLTPLITGYRVSKETASGMGLGNTICRGAVPSSASQTVLIPASGTKHIRIRNIHTSGGSNHGASRYRVVLSFGDGSTFHRIMPFYCNGQQPWHWPEFNFNNMHITGPAGHAVYVQLLPNTDEQPIAINVCAEYVDKSETQNTTGSYPDSEATAPVDGGKYFWAHLQGPSDPDIYSLGLLAKTGSQLANHIFLIDGAYMQKEGHTTNVLNYVGMFAGNPSIVDIGGGVIIPVPTINTIPSMAQWDQAQYYEHAIAYSDLGGLPCVQPSLAIVNVDNPPSTNGQHSSITVWGRIASKNSAQPGIGDGSGVFFGSNPA